MRHLIMQVVKPEQMRYPTVGDWQKLPMTKQIELEINPPDYVYGIWVADTGDKKTNFLVALHEIVEQFMCQEAGITTQEVDEWDMSHPELDEPGDDVRCPYHKQHDIAIRVERFVAGRSGLNMNWDEHEARIDNTYEKVKEALDTKRAMGNAPHGV
jgi:hypothetical protein